MRFQLDSSSQNLVGTDEIDVFIADTAQGIGMNTIENFSTADALCLTTELPDLDGDGIINLGNNGVLDTDGPDLGVSTIDFNNPEITSLRLAGTFEEDGETRYVYVRNDASDAEAEAALAAAEPHECEITVIDNTVDTGLVRVENFSTADGVCLTMALPDGNGDGIINFGNNGILDIDGSDDGDNFILFDDPTVTGVRLAGTFEEDGETRYVYVRSEATDEEAAKVLAKAEAEGHGDDVSDPITPPPSEDETQTTTTEGVTTSDGLVVGGELNGPTTSFDGTAEIDGVISIDGFIGAGSVDIAFVFDVSGSTFAPFGGTPVGDVNNDLIGDTILDAEVAALLNLSDEIAALGFADEAIDIAVIPFASGAANVGVFDPGSDPLETALTDPALPGAGGGTNFQAGLAEAVTFFEDQAASGSGADANIVFFLSDGFDGGFDPSAEIAALQDPAGINATIAAIGVGNGASLPQLDEIDNTGGAEIVTDTDSLTAELVGSPVEASDIAMIEILVDDVVELVLDEDSDFTATPLGTSFGPELLTTLSQNPGDVSEIIARVTFDDADMTTFDLSLDVDIVDAPEMAEAANAVVDDMAADAA